MLAIYKKELRSYFTSIIGYLFVAFFLVLIGIYTYFNNLYYEYADFTYTLYSVRLFFVLLIPMITMRILAEEKKQKTDQLLLTSPVSISKIILGKYLAIISVFFIVILIISCYPLLLSRYGTVNFLMSYAAIFAFFLVGCVYLAIGMFISAMTESQAFAAIMTFVVVLMTLLSSGISSILPTDNKSAWMIFALVFVVISSVVYILLKNRIVTAIVFVVSEVALGVLYFLNPSFYDGSAVKFLDWFSIIDRYTNFVYGVFDLSAIVYYLSLCSLFLFLTMQVIKKRRWS